MKEGAERMKSPHANTEWNKTIIETRESRERWKLISYIPLVRPPENRLTYYVRQVSSQPSNCTTRPPGDKHKHLHKNCTPELYRLWENYRSGSYITAHFTVAISVYDCTTAQNHTADPGQIRTCFQPSNGTYPALWMQVKLWWYKCVITAGRVEWKSLRMKAEDRRDTVSVPSRGR